MASGNYSELQDQVVYGACLNTQHVNEHMVYETVPILGIIRCILARSSAFSQCVANIATLLQKKIRYNPLRKRK